MLILFRKFKNNKSGSYFVACILSNMMVQTDLKLDHWFERKMHLKFANKYNPTRQLMVDTLHLLAFPLATAIAQGEFLCFNCIIVRRHVFVRDGRKKSFGRWIGFPVWHVHLNQSEEYSWPNGLDQMDG